MRRVVISFVVLIVVAGVAAGWWWWRPRARPAPGGERSAAVRETTRPVRTVPVADLVLQLNGADTTQVTAGTAVFFTVTLTGTSPEPAFRLGAPGKPWSANLRFETPDGKPVTFVIEQLGPPSTSRFGDLAAVAAPTPQSEVAIVDATHVHQIEFGVNPEQAARFQAGAHAVRAVLPLDSARGGLTQLVSNTVTLSVAHASPGAQPAPDADKVRLEAAARFYLRAEKWQDAHRHALQLVERHDADTVAYTLLADALDGLRRDDEALAAYREALASLPEGVDESPDYLLARMEAVLHRLETSQGQKGEK
jgi:hypothetical protein